MLDISDGLAATPGTSRARSGCRCVIDLDRVPLADGARVDDLGFGEDYELLAATPDPLASLRSGAASKSGAGVSDGTPLDGGWDHFR